MLPCYQLKGMKALASHVALSHNLSLTWQGIGYPITAHMKAEV